MEIDLSDEAMERVENLFGFKFPTDSNRQRLEELSTGRSRVCPWGIPQCPICCSDGSDVAPKEEKCTCNIFWTCEFCKQRPAREQIKGDAHAIAQANNEATTLAEKNPKAKFEVSYKRTTDGKNMKQGQKAKVL